MRKFALYNAHKSAILAAMNTSITHFFLASIEWGARAEGLPLSEVFKRADVSLSNWARWKSGKHSPQLDKIERLLDVIMSERLKNAA